MFPLVQGETIFFGHIEEKKSLVREQEHRAAEGRGETLAGSLGEWTCGSEQGLVLSSAWIQDHNYFQENILKSIHH